VNRAVRAGKSVGMESVTSPWGDPFFRRVSRGLVVAALVVTIGGVLWMATGVLDHVHNVLVVLIFSVLFGYAVYPPIKWLAARRVPVTLAGLIVYAVIIGLVLGAVAWLAPAVAKEAQALTRDFPHVVAQTQAQIADPTDSPLLGRLPAGVRSAIAENAGKVGTLAGASAGAFGANALGILSGTTAVLINVGLTLALTLMIVGDLPQIRHFGVRIVPRRYRDDAIGVMAEIDRVVGGFVRGQLLLAFGVAVAGTLVLVTLGVPYALLLGLLAGAASIVPIIGPIVALLPVIPVAFFTVGIVKAAVVVALYLVIILVQQNVLPLVNARAVGITPLVVFVSLLLGSEAFGILGALLAIPIAGILRVAAHRLFPPDADADRRFALARERADEPALRG